MINNSQSRTDYATSSIKIKKPLVLVVESQPEIRFVLRKWLEILGIEMAEAKSGEEAVDVAVCARPDLILIDWSLPNLDGFQTTRLIRSIASFDNVPIVFHSGNSEKAYQIKAFAVGGNDYFLKPLKFETLNGILEKFLKTRGFTLHA
jgi:CheY-like chemotaxis protein